MRSVVLAAFVALLSTTAQAAEELQFGPPPAWVKPEPEVKPGPAPSDGGPLRILRQDLQLDFGPDGDAAYQESAAQIRTTMGLAMSGTITLSWDPARETVTVHKLRILRDGQAIDVLARQSFTVIRREQNLTEIVDGALTATIQPEDLRVGDIVEMAYTQVHLDPVLAGRTDFEHDIGDLRGVDRFTLRARWPSAEPIVWRAGSGLAKPKVTRKDGITELAIDLKNPEPLKGPLGAPSRYWPTRDLEFSEFASWSEVAATVADDFARAAVLAPDSPLKAEVAKIRALSDDPKVQAAAALKLVEEQVRYLALILTDGGYTPVDADKTWTRRFGDCKAKTVLLVALLHELGIEAEPVLVNAAGPEDLDKGLPRLSAFNHVIARVTIGDKVYWLDGTRTGDGALDSLRVPPHRWGLPLRAENAQLIALVQPARDLPDAELILEVDATGGIEAPAPVKGRMVTRGDLGLWSSMLSANLPAEDRDRMLKAMWARYSWIEVKTVAVERDLETGESRIDMTGTAKMKWWRGTGGQRWFLVPEAALGGPTAFKRDPGPNDDAPYAVAYPAYVANRLVLKLPYEAEGFTVPAPDVDQTVAARAYLRRTRIENGVMTIETSTRAVAPEFPASEAAAAAEALTAMSKVHVYVQAPRLYRPTDGDIAAWLAETPKTAEDFVLRGGKLMQAGRTKEGLADFTKAIALDPKSSDGFAARGLARINSGEVELAKADLQEAERLDPRSVGVQMGLGTLAMEDGRMADAVAAYTRASDLSKDNIAAIGGRGDAYRRMGEPDKALADYSEVLRIEPTAYKVYQARAEVYAGKGQRDAALAEIDAGLKLSPDNAEFHLIRGALLVRMGRRADADAAFARSIELDPSARTYLTRSANRPKSDLAGRLADIDAADKAEPDSADVAAVRAKFYIDTGEAARAVPLLNRAIKANPKALGLKEIRTEAYVKSGQAELARQDIAARRAGAAGDAIALNALCWTAATLGLDLDAALADCEAALALKPDFPAALDSHGFVLLRLGRARDSVTAYDAALALRPDQPESLYGRGLAKLRLGETAAGEKDLAAAKAMFADVEAEFDDFGLSPPKPAAEAAAS